MNRYDRYKWLHKTMVEGWTYQKVSHGHFVDLDFFDYHDLQIFFFD